MGFFVGAEKADVNAVDLGIDDTTFYVGVNYYKTLGGTTDYDYFAKGMLRGVLTSSDIASLGESVESDSNSYGFEAGFGANFYVANHTLTPELAISYDRVNVDGFTMRCNIYQDNNINLFMGKLGASWQAQWNENLSTILGGGVRFNFKDDFEQGVIVNNQLFNTKTELGNTYYYVTLRLNYALSDSWDISVIYNGDFSNKSSAHNSGFVKLGYWW